MYVYLFTSSISPLVVNFRSYVVENYVIALPEALGNSH